MANRKRIRYLRIAYDSLSERKIMSINSIRSLLYKLARILGDISAISKGKPGKRISRRIAGKATGKILRRIFR